MKWGIREGGGLFLVGWAILVVFLSDTHHWYRVTSGVCLLDTPLVFRARSDSPRPQTSGMSTLETHVTKRSSSVACPHGGAPLVGGLL